MKVTVKVVRALVEYEAGYDLTKVREVGVAKDTIPITDVDVSLFETIGNKIVELSEKAGTVRPALIFIEFDIDPEYEDYVEQIWDVTTSDRRSYINAVLNWDDEAGWKADVIPTLAIDGTVKNYSANRIKTALVEAARKVLG